MRQRVVLGLGVLALVASACGASGSSAASASASASGSHSAAPASVSAPSASSGTASASATLGHLRLELRLDKTAWRVGEPMTGTATLTNTGPAIPITSSSERLSFRYAEVGGTRKLEAVWPADCVSGTFDPAKPITSGLIKSGGYSPDNPADAWIKTFIEAVGVQLPAGRWDVTALTSVNVGDCGPLPAGPEATVRVVVLP
ncbi:MAG TPA: hypothetical protein VIR16_07745 [Candidatus Limnocylindrales bacterium]